MANLTGESRDVQLYVGLEIERDTEPAGPVAIIKGQEGAEIAIPAHQFFELAVHVVNAGLQTGYLKAKATGAAAPALDPATLGRALAEALAANPVKLQLDVEELRSLLPSGHVTRVTARDSAGRIEQTVQAALYEGPA